MSSSFDPYAPPTTYTGAMAAPVAEPAGFGARFLAVLIDAILVLIVTGILFTVLRLPADSGGAQLINLVIALGYYCGMWTYNNGQTLGKQALKIRVVRVDGQPITITTALIRYVGYWVNTVPILIGWFWALRAEKRTFGDMISNTRVVKA